tara:strand:+ start:149337 stop:150431 length:1095 start_codon:yes stop_codon:yes gene_type:complete
MYMSFGQNSAETLLFVGSYTDGQKSDGIHVYSLQTDGSLTERYKQSDLVNASFVAVSPNGKYLYSVTESKLEEDGSVSAFKIQSASGKLTFLNKQTTHGRNPVHLNIYNDGKYIVSGNYSDAVVNIYECAADGSLKPSSQLMEFSGSSVVSPNQDVAHAHSTNFSPDGKYLYVMDLGADKIHAFKFNEKNTPKLEAFDKGTYAAKPGSGPRHFAFHPNGKYGYCINELNGTITTFTYKQGILEPIAADFSYAEERENYQGADIHVSPDGKFLYASNRGENTLAIFAIAENSGNLKLVGHEPTFGDHPRSFVIDPSGKYLVVANQVTGNLVTFKRDVKTGKLTKLPKEIQLKAPASLKMKEYSKH